MTPERFKEQNVVYAKDQPQYLQLPCHRAEDGTLTICWRLTWRERLRLLWTGRLWHTVLTFNQPLQPICLAVEKPPIQP